MSDKKTNSNTQELLARLELHIAQAASVELTNTGASQVQTYMSIMQVIASFLQDTSPIVAAEIFMAQAAITINFNTGDIESAIAANRMLNKHVRDMDAAFVIKNIHIKGRAN